MQIEAARFVCYLNNPHYPMCWTEGYAKAWLKGMEKIKMNEIKTVKGDKEIATELRKKFFDALDPVAELIAEANASGFEVGFQFGPNAFGKVQVQAINLMKEY